MGGRRRRTFLTGLRAKRVAGEGISEEQEKTRAAHRARLAARPKPPPREHVPPPPNTQVRRIRRFVAVFWQMAVTCRCVALQRWSV